jgi:hypothetical protein
MDVGIGAAGSEQVIVSDLLVGGAPLTANFSPYIGREFWLPLFIPQGSAVSVRIASQRTAATFKLVGWWYGGSSDPPPWRVASKITTYGVGTVPNGTVVVPGTSTAQGSWTQITAATTRDHFGVFPSFQISGTIMTLKHILVGLGLGGAGAEQTFQGGSGYAYMTTAAEEVIGPFNNVFPVYDSIPAGTRLVARASNTGGNDPYDYQVALHGLG